MSQHKKAGIGIIESKEVYIPTDTEISNCWYIQIRITTADLMSFVCHMSLN